MLGDFVGAFGRPAAKRNFPLDGSSPAVQQKAAFHAARKLQCRVRVGLRLDAVIRDCRMNGGFVRVAVIASARLAAASTNDRFYRCTAAKAVGLGI